MTNNENDDNIFNWMRAQVPQRWRFCDIGYVMKIFDVNNIITEAKAKWESDCCEWKFEKNTGLVWHCENECEGYNISYQRELKTFLEEFKSVCPRCGKPIKIVEVE